MIETFNKLSKPLQALFANITDRFSNPLGGAFLFSWIIINWKAVYYFLFSNEKVADKIIYLEKIYITNEIINLWLLIYLPITLALIYLLISPFISNIATGIWSFLNTSLEAKRKKWVNGISIMSEHDKHDMLLSIHNERATHKAKIADLQNEINGLRNINILQEEQNGKIEPNPNVFELNLGNKETDESTQITNKELLTKLSADTFSHKVKMWVAEKFNLNYDLPSHKQNIEFIFTLLKIILTRGSYEPSTMSISNKAYSIENVIAQLYQLEKLEFVTQNAVDNTYSLSSNTIASLKKIIKG